MKRTAGRPRGCWGFRNTREEGVAMKTKFTSILLGLFLCLIVIGTGWSQETTAAINGQVNDASGAAVANATITAKDLDHGRLWATRTHVPGYCNLARLTGGPFCALVDAQGV